MDIVTPLPPRVLLAIDEADAQRWIDAHPSVGPIRWVVPSSRADGMRVFGLHATDAAKTHPDFTRAVELLSRSEAKTPLDFDVPAEFIRGGI